MAAFTRAVPNRTHNSQYRDETGLVKTRTRSSVEPSRLGNGKLHGRGRRGLNDRTIPVQSAPTATVTRERNRLSGTNGLVRSESSDASSRCPNHRPTMGASPKPRLLGCPCASCANAASDGPTGRSPIANVLLPFSWVPQTAGATCHSRKPPAGCVGSRGECRSDKYGGSLAHLQGAPPTRRTR